jgi:peptide/nickel transport system substrate-binding protein
MNFTRGLGRYAITGAMAAALLVTALPKNSAAAPADQGGSRRFPETNQTVAGRFLEVWQGGRSDADAVFINGYPITDKHAEQSLEDGKIYPTQWFERARFEEHQENQKPYDVLLGRLGAFTAEGRKDVPFRGIDNPGGSAYYTKETRHTVGDSSEGGQAILNAWKAKGGLAQFGFPLSQPFQEVTKETDPKVAGKSFLVQYFERQRFEYHPENKGTAFEVLLGRLGAEQKDQVAEVEKVNPFGARTNPVDTLNVGRGQDPSGLLPFSSNTLVGSNFLAAVFNGLTKRDEQDNVLADLAMYVPTLENGGAYYVGTGDDKRLVVKYKLKHGVKWYDGQELTSNDLIYTYNLILDPDFPAVDRTFYEKIASIDNPDKYTLIVNFLTWKEASALIGRDKDTYSFLQAFVDSKGPVTDPLYNEGFGYVLPQHFLAKTAAKDVANLPWANTPWGTGPYYVKEFKANQSITMEMNPNYNVTQTKPVIKTIFSPYDKDNKQLPVKIGTGALDLTTSESFTPDLLPQAQDVAKQAGAKVVVKPYYGYDHIDFNTSKEPFNDVRLRQAVAYALDRNAINQALFAGSIQLMQSVDGATNWASIENPANKTKYAALTSKATIYNFDVAKANALLDDAGWKMNSATGIREKNGKALKVTFLTTTKAYRIKLADIQQQQLKAVGIDSAGTPKPSATVFADPPDGPLYTGSYGDYGMVEFGWGGGSDEPKTSIGLFGCSSIPSDANNHSGQNDEFWCNQEYDGLVGKAEAMLGHPAERVQLYLQAQAVFMKEVPSIPLFNIPSIYMAKNGTQFHGHPNGVLIDWQDWYLAK